MVRVLGNVYSDRLLAKPLRRTKDSKKQTVWVLISNRNAKFAAKRKRVCFRPNAITTRDSYLKYAIFVAFARKTAVSVKMR